MNNKLAITAPFLILIAVIGSIAWMDGNNRGYRAGMEKGREKGREIWKSTYISEGWTKGYGECHQERLCSELRKEDTLSDSQKIEYKTKCVK